MKKLIAILLVLFMLTFVAACNDDPVNTETNPPSTNTDTETSTDSNTDTNTDTNTDSDLDTDTDSSIGENQNDILGPNWTPPQS